MSCTCKIPSKANYHVEVIIGRDVPGGTETSDVQLYFCDEHVPCDDEFEPYDPWFAGWYMLEWNTTHLR